MLELHSHGAATSPAAIGCKRGICSRPVARAHVSLSCFCGALQSRSRKLRSFDCGQSWIGQGTPPRAAHSTFNGNKDIRALDSRISSACCFLIKHESSSRPDLRCQAGAGGSEVAEAVPDEPVRSSKYEAWNATTERLTALSTVAGLFMMVPQILKNATLLRANQGAALGILSWLGFATGFLGNMLLLSYFTAKRELSACLVQVVGATSTAILLAQVFIAGFMPPPAFTAVAAYLLLGCAVNCLRFTRHLPQPLWDTWQDVIGVLGLAVLPQVIWSTFSSITTKLPGTISAVGGLLFIVAMRRGLVGQPWRDRWQLLSGWTATLLFMVMPVAQLQVCFTRPDQLAGMSALSSLLGIVGNGLMVPRALFTRDFIWFLGCSWGCILMGWGVLLAMALHGFYPPRLFMAVSLALIGYLAVVFKFDADAHGCTPLLGSISGHPLHSDPLRNLISIGGNPVTQALRELDDDSLCVPKVVVEEFPDAFKFIATVPGLEKKDMQVQVRGKDVLTITGKRTREERDGDDSNRVVKEFSSFKRSFRLPRGVSTKKVTAVARNGVLTVTVPKKTSSKVTSGRSVAHRNANAVAKDNISKQGGLNGEQRVSKRRKVVHFAPGC
ncbi:unnamed protein product [Closterium sp. Yama58-4]|nr:unnamed protein product [Closterium sp. Yama58-4]